ncbi:MAG: protein-S-isoprenylcysteine methyltransferase [Verrucomicrobia bacterium]|nr:protein-S-isoprenylcysteine methyltransferase [Verrucomicrobiota bacterium]
MAPDMNLPQELGLAYLVSETLLRFMRRSSGDAKAADRGSLALLWSAIGCGVAIGMISTRLFPFAGFQLSTLALQLAVAVFAAALLLRWWAILVLGKFFTVDVAIASDHRLVMRGPYRLLRHPSYTGMMLAFAAFAVTLQNWISIIGVLVPISLALAFRIRIEEAALTKAFGDDYRRYSSTTKRLIPGVL